ALSVPAIEDHHCRKEGYAGDRIECDEPGGRQFFAEENEVKLLVAPNQVGVKDLVVGHNGQRQHRNQQNQGSGYETLSAAERRTLRAGGSADQILLWQILLACNVNRKPDEHANTGGSESVMPANVLAEGADNEGCGNHSHIDGQVINLERIGASQVFRF